MEYEFRDLVTGEYTDPDMNTYSAVALLREHRERWVFRTSAGDIVLRRPPLRIHRILESTRRRIAPSVAMLAEELRILAHTIEGVPEDEIAQDTKDRIGEISDQLRFSDLTPLAVVVLPQLGCMDDYDDLLNALKPEEREVLESAVIEVGRVRRPSEVDSTEFDIAQRYHLDVIPDDMVGSMTVSQADWLARRLNAETKALERAQRGGR